jgi:hypothetical protein
LRVIRRASLLSAILLLAKGDFMLVFNYVIV